MQGKGPTPVGLGGGIAKQVHGASCPEGSEAHMVLDGEALKRAEGEEVTQGRSLPAPLGQALCHWWRLPVEDGLGGEVLNPVWELLPWCVALGSCHCREHLHCKVVTGADRVVRRGVTAALASPRPPAFGEVAFSVKVSWKKAQAQTLMRLEVNENTLGRFSDAVFFNDDPILKNRGRVHIRDCLPPKPSEAPRLRAGVSGLEAAWAAS